MQSAGQTCELCGKAIVFAAEALHCSRCETFVHVGCGGSACNRCGANLSGYVRPPADVRREAILPRALRPVKTGAAGVAVLFIFLATLLTLYVLSRT